jgi:phage protein D
MSVVTLQEESKRKEIGSFYVPRFELKIEGAGLPRDILRDVVQATYRDNIKEIDSFELTVNNWDAEKRDFKYIGSETAKDLQANTPESQRFKIFEPCNKDVELRMGYLDSLNLMVKGTFTTMEPTFPTGGAPTLNVRGLNVLHQLRRKQYTYAWDNEKPSAIAKNIATLTDPETKKKRFPIPIVISDKAKSDEEALTYVTQNNQYDIDFLLLLARKYGYVVFVREGDKKARTKDEKERHLYFGPSNDTVAGIRKVTFELKWGISLVDFKPTLTTANQIKSVTVNGWDRKAKKRISETVTLDDKKLTKVNGDLHELLKKCDPREEHVADEPVFTKKEARKRAEAILLDRQKEMVKASGTCVGLPDLRAGQLVHIVGIGSRLSGVYFITDTTHTINDNGYNTKFNARREDPGEKK